jgi:hypothetical protein
MSGFWDATAAPADDCRRGTDWVQRPEPAHLNHDYLILIIYSIFPVIIYLMYKKRPAETPAPPTLGLLIAFIVLCGLIHLCQGAVIPWVPYRLFALLSAVTAAASAVTAGALLLVVGRLARLGPTRSPGARRRPSSPAPPN